MQQRPGQQDITGDQSRPAELSRTWRRSWPLQAIGTLVVAVAAAFAVSVLGVPLGKSGPAADFRVSIDMGHLITICGSIAFFVFALISTFAFARWAKAVLEHFVGAAYGAIVRYVMILIGICVVLVTALSLLGFPVTQLVVGGAVTGVLITIAAQQSLSNLFAGVMLQFARPFQVGDLVRVRSGGLAGTIEGTVSEFSITYVRLETDEGRVYLPHSQVLAAAVSPVRASDAQDEAGEAGLLT